MIRTIVTGQEAGSVLTFYNRGLACGTLTVSEPEASNLVAALRTGGLDVVDLREPAESIDRLVASI